MVVHPARRPMQGANWQQAIGGPRRPCRGLMPARPPMLLQRTCTASSSCQPSLIVGLKSLIAPGAFVKHRAECLTRRRELLRPAASAS